MFQRAQWVGLQDLRPVEKLILLFLSSMANEEGTCYPSVQLLATYCGVSTRTVQRAIKRFEASNLLKVTTRRRPGGLQSSNCYHLQDAKEVRPNATTDSSRYDKALSPLPRQIVTPGVTQLCQGGGDTAMSPHEVHTEEPINYVVRKQAVDNSLHRTNHVLTEEDISTARKLLSHMSQEDAKLLFSEMRAAIKVPGLIKTTPIRYLRGLIKKHQNGEFNPFLSKNKTGELKFNKSTSIFSYLKNIDQEQKIKN